VPFTSVHAGKYRTEDKKLKTNQKKANNTKYSKQNHPGSVACYDTRPGNEVGVIYNAPEPTWGQSPG